jgi:hypothetical protein
VNRRFENRQLARFGRGTTLPGKRERRPTMRHIASVLLSAAVAVAGLGPVAAMAQSFKAPIRIGSGRRRWRAAADRVVRWDP